MQVNFRSYSRVKAADPSGPMGGYTRVLHSERPDDIMHLVPTLLVRMLPEEMQRGYAPMNRPWAICQFLARAQIAEEYILMTEPDHVFVRAPPLEATLGRAVLWFFNYVNCPKPPKPEQCSRREFNDRGIRPDQIARVRSAGHTLAQLVSLPDACALGCACSQQMVCHLRHIVPASLSAAPLQTPSSAHMVC